MTVQITRPGSGGMGVSFSDAAPAHRSLKDQHHEGRRTTLPYYEVNVPTMNSSGRRGLRIFTGEADKPGAAIQIAHKIYAAAVAAQQSGLHIAGRRPDGWGARGVRPCWELDWSAATASLWNDPYSWRHVIDLQP
ncbi:hypothetical protein ABT124_42170 [Streptomyces sp. NPDC001982]|uniref:hypothetical protein n=1 Tax=Streptomyces sp. NPDC001982 TaxID=3154405 RepID=UPI00331A9373